LIVHSGSEIIVQEYSPETIRHKNAELNQLVNEYRRPEIIPFASDGASHINFITVKIHKPNTKCYREITIQQLGLDTQVSRV
jgi:hypothetical protein